MFRNTKLLRFWRRYSILWSSKSSWTLFQSTHAIISRNNLPIYVRFLLE